MAAEGVDILDIGGESTRPGAAEVPVADEIAPHRAGDRRRSAPPGSPRRSRSTPAKPPSPRRRWMPAPTWSTTSPPSAFDPELAALCAARDVPVCLMHAKGTPATMQKAPDLRRCARRSARVSSKSASTSPSGRGSPRDRIVTDPGIGFGKTPSPQPDPAARPRRLPRPRRCRCCSAPRASASSATIGGAPEAKDRLGGSLAVALHGAAQGVHILRVHDTQATTQALRLFAALNATDGRRVSR